MKVWQARLPCAARSASSIFEQISEFLRLRCRRLNILITSETTSMSFSTHTPGVAAIPMSVADLASYMHGVEPAKEKDQGSLRAAD